MNNEAPEPYKGSEEANEQHVHTKPSDSMTHVHIARSGVRVATGIRIDSGLWKAFKLVLSANGLSTCHVLELFILGYLGAVEVDVHVGQTINVYVDAPRVVKRVRRRQIVFEDEGQQPDSMLDLEVDVVREQLKPHVDKLKKIKPTPDWRDLTKTRFNRERIEKLLPKAIRLVRRSRDQDLERLVFEARELLRV